MISKIYEKHNASIISNGYHLLNSKIRYVNNVFHMTTAKSLMKFYVRKSEPKISFGENIIFIFSDQSLRYFDGKRLGYVGNENCVLSIGGKRYFISSKLERRVCEILPWNYLFPQNYYYLTGWGVNFTRSFIPFCIAIKRIYENFPRFLKLKIFGMTI